MQDQDDGKVHKPMADIHVDAYTGIQVDIHADILTLYSMGLLEPMLKDWSTERHIVWAADTYSYLGPAYGPDKEITPELLSAHSCIITARARKGIEERSIRAKRHGEVSTPLRLCGWMCTHASQMLQDDMEGWQEYVDARVLEPACGEAPFLACRYTPEDGRIIPVPDRPGLLDLKLHAASRHTQTEKDWLIWAFRAFQAVFGYELQGDSLLTARVNFMMTFRDHMRWRWGREPSPAEYHELTTVIAWNLWQMDGMAGTVPYGAASDCPSSSPCLVRNWLSDRTEQYAGAGGQGITFALAIGNPPYQKETVGGQKTFAPPAYHLFLEDAYRYASRVVMVHPARFLFNASSTPKAGNRKMLSDPYLEVLRYWTESGAVFPGTQIKGGIAVTCRDSGRECGVIGTFTPYPELNSILHKVAGAILFASIVSSRSTYRLTAMLHEDHPEALAQLSSGHPYDMATNIFQCLPQVFHDAIPQDGHEYIRILGRDRNSRTYKFIRADYVNQPASLYGYKIFLPKSSGSGKLCEPLSSPVLADPGTGATETFIGIGTFGTMEETQAALKYIKTKFARTILGALKTTQDITPGKWAHVPLQDFTASSDIDWSQTVQGIDWQLYAKYRLDGDEIRFIEGHAKEMA